MVKLSYLRGISEESVSSDDRSCQGSVVASGGCVSTTTPVAVAAPVLRQGTLSGEGYGHEHYLQNETTVSHHTVRVLVQVTCMSKPKEKMRKTVHEVSDE